MDNYLQETLERSVRARAGRQVRDLRVEVRAGRVVLFGQAGSYYAKQLAQAGVREVLPEITLENAISVASLPTSPS